MNHSIYLKDPGIYKKGNVFYDNTGKRVTDSKTLLRVESFRVPPAWKSVWYASNPKCHVQVHGIDQGGKKQYILSEKWVNNARYKKYTRMKSFMKDIQKASQQFSTNRPCFNHGTHFQPVAVAGDAPARGPGARKGCHLPTPARATSGTSQSTLED